MKNVGLKLTISALICLSIITSTVAMEQTINLRNTQLILDQVLAAQAVQPSAKLGWWI